MTVFERSALGQQNRNLFLQSDLVVYHEGGNDRNGFRETFDLGFWSSVFKAFRPDLKVRFIPKGSKSTVTGLIDSIISQNVSGVCVALDADYDQLNGRLIDDRRVIYTYGYSYENDVFVSANLINVFYALCPRCPQELDITNIVNGALDNLSALRRLAIADYLSGQIGRSAIDRDKCPKYFGSTPRRSLPTINFHAVYADVIRANTKPRSAVAFPSGLNFVIGRHLVGHLYAEFCYRLLVYLHGLHSTTTKISRDVFFSMANQTIRDFFQDNVGHDVSIHYRTKLVAVPT